ncbi:MAG: tandem-95 repeat protein [Lyngbya sp. HA4199-MV5]|jgi:ELWxxDGT repeat protein|nr:tandem-95 repeat protein [Lyngbya sp. HA4199-MV5]
MPDIAGNSLGTATSLSLTSNVQSLPDIVTATANDYYRFTLSHRSSFNLSLNSLSADANIALLSSTGSVLSINSVLQVSSNTGNLAETINTPLDAGTYYIRVAPAASATTADYRLNVSAKSDLKTDILWRNYATGENVTWQISGTSLEAFASLEKSADLNWAMQGSGDFNQDGQADLVWRNYKTGENGIWLMNGTVRTGAVFLESVGDLNWQIQGVGDFNQDGQADLVWRNYKTGENAAWLMNKTVRTGAASFLTIGDPNWHIQGVGDFNGDSKADLVWRNYSTGQNAIWLMNGTTLSTGIFINPVGGNWIISGVGDFNNDGKSDLLWRNYSSGENAIWLLNGTSVSSTFFIYQVGDLNWRSIAPLIRAVEPSPISVAGTTLSNAFNIGSNLTGSGTYRNSVGSLNNDYYQFNLGTPSAVNLTLTNLTANLDVQLVNSSNQVLQRSTLSGTSAETMTSTLAAGTYYVRVYAANGDTSAYALNLLINNLPVVVTNAGLTLDEGSTTTISSTLLQVTDNDHPTTQLTYTLGSVPGQGALSLNGAAIGVGAIFTQTDINANKLSYHHDGSETLSDSFSFTVTDPAGGTTSNTFNIIVNPVNDAPVLTVPDGQIVDQNANSLIAGVVIADPDVGVGSETITISAANGVVSLGLTAGLTFAQGNGSPATSITVSGTLSALNTALTSLIYRSNASFQGIDTISVSVNDQGNTGKGGALTDSKTIAVTVKPVNKAPTITVPAAQTVNEDTSLSLTGISIGDVDANGGNETVSLSAINGVLSLSTTAGLTFLTGTGSKDRNITVSGTLALINAALQSLTYQANKDFNGSDVITVNVNDNGNIGNGVALSDTKSLSITVTPVNDAPILMVPTAQTVNENTALYVTGVSVSDVDASSGAIAVSLAATNGKLSLGSTTGLSFTSGNGTTPSTTLIFSGTLAAVNSALSTLIYRGNANFSGTDSISLNVNDNGNTGFGIPLSDSKTIALTVLGVNQAPVIQVPLAPSTTANTNLTITGVSISDPDAAGGTETVTIAAANGVLSLPSNTGLTFTQGTGNQNNRVTFQGTLAAINTAIGNLVYRSYPGFTGFDTISISVNDGGNTGIGTALSDTKTLFVNVGGAVNTAPTANPDSYSTTRNTALTIVGQGVLVNDIDPENNALTANLLTTPTQGSIVFNSNGTFTYTPNANYVGNDSFTYRASDGIGNSNSTTVSLNVTAPANQAPTATADSFTLSQNSTFTTGNVLSNDSDPDNNVPLTATLVAGSTQGSVNLNANGTFTYIPTANFSGTDSFTYAAKDALGAASTTATVNLSVTAPTNQAPTATADSFTLSQNSTFTTGNVLSNDSDPDNNVPLTATLVAGTTQGSVNLNPNGTFTYIPTANFSGTDSFTYVAKDALGATSTTATVNLSVTAPTNQAPTAAADSFTLSQNSTFTIGNVLSNDSDPDNNVPLTATLIAGTTQGTLNLNTNGTFTYIPTANFSGTDYFTYVAKDALGATSTTATVSLSVTAPTNQAPTAAADSFTLSQNSTFTTGNVLSNDSDPDNNVPLTATLIAGTTQGSVNLNPNGTFTYIPTVNFSGTDSFTYVAKDALGATSTTATVSLSVTAPTNQAPTATADSFTLSQNSTFTTGNVLSNDSDPDNNVPLTATLVAGTTQGSVNLNTNGTFTYIPTTNFSGTDSFTYVAKDALGATSTTATVSLSVTAPTNQAPTATADSFILSQNSTFTTGNVLSNDSDPDNNVPLTATLVAGTTQGSVNLNPNGTFTYIPTANFSGTDSFTYVAKDALGATSTTATVSLSVTAPTNQAPTAAADSFILSQNSAFTTGNVLSNDSDPDNNVPLTATLVAGTTQGSVNLNPNGTFTYIPTANFSGTDSFTYVAQDALGATSTSATVSLSVTAPTNQAPTAAADSFTLSQNSTFTTGNVLSNDSDPDNNIPLTATLVAGSTQGSVNLNTDGTFTYIPTTNFSGTDSFTYVAKDALGAASTTATVNLSVTALTNQAPTAAADSFTLSQNSTFTTGNVLSNDSDPDNNVPLTATLVTGTTQGSVNLNTNGTFTYIPTANFSGTDSFTYVAKDALGAASTTATVNLSVTAPTNQSPTATADSFTLSQNSTFTTGNVLSNDSDPDNNVPLTATLVAGTTQGSVNLNTNGTFTYIPTANFSGTDSFTYVAKDALGAASTTATVNLSVTAPTNQAPTVAADSFTLSQNSTFTTGNVLSNDSDPDNNVPLTATLVTGTTQGSVNLNTNGTFTYIPTANFSGTDSFTYVAKDALGAASTTATVNLSVTAPTNQAPTVAADSFTLSQNSTFTTGNVLSNDSDPDNNVPLTATLVAGTTQGSVNLNTNGTFTYIPTANFSGTDSFTYVAKDALGATSATATVNLSVTAPTNQAPTATADRFRAVTDTPLTVSAATGVLKNDTDAESSTLTALLVSNSSNGSVALNADGSFVYTPTTGFTGSDTFVYKANDGALDSSPATVTLTVFGNTAPTANTDTYVVSAGVPLTVVPFSGVLQNDSDTEGDPLTASLVTPSSGSLTFNGDGSFVYTPNAGVTNGTDTFVYRVSDGFSTSSSTTVTLNIGTNAAPIAQDDTYSAFAGGTLTVSQFSGVLSNDTDAQPLIASVVSNAGQGTVSLNSDGSFTYVPNASFTGGTDTFVYQASDGTLATSATVTLNVSAATAPTAQDDVYQVVAGTTLSVGQTSSLLSNDSDTNGATLTAQLVSNPSQGTLLLNTDGTFAYTPNASVTTATDTFVYRANNGAVNSNPATVTLSIVSNALPVVANDSYSVTANNALTINTPGVLANDTDSDAGQTVRALLANQPTHGSLLLRANGSFVYTPDAGYIGADSFTYRANDGLQDSANVGTVSLSIVSNAAPVTNTDTYSVNKNNVLVKNAASGVLQNDTDSTPLTASLVNAPTKGTLALNSDGSFTYTPNAGVTNTTDTFVYAASDGTLSTNATVTVTIKDTSSPPTAVNDTGYTVNANGTLTIAAGSGVLTNDTDPEGDFLKAIGGTAPTHGTVSLGSDGSFVYTPTAGYLGTDSFTYFANDGIVNSLNPATVSIVVGGANNAPTITVPASQVVFRNSDLVIQSGLSVSDPDAGSNPVAVTLTSASGNLTLSTTTNLTVTGDGSKTVTLSGSLSAINAALTNLVYRPVNSGFTGTDQITIAVNDNGNTGSGGAQTANAAINVNVTDGPTLVRDLNPTQNATATGTNSSTPNNLTNADGGTLYFSANDGGSGVELWRSNGTSAGTSLVADLNTVPDASGSSNPSNLTVIGNTLYFTANNSVRGTELWKVDLTSATNPTIVRDIRSGSSSSNPRNLVNFNGTLYFEADDGGGLVLWKTDGTTANTVKVETSASYSQPGLIVAAGTTLFFTAGNGNQLWRLGASGTQTTLLQDIGAGAGITNLVVIGNTLFFTATNSSNGLELWRSDGTTAGTTRISDINPGTGDSSPSSLVNVNGTLYFIAKNGANVYGLWQSTAAGVVSLVSALPSAGQVPTNLTAVGSKVFLIVDAGTSSAPDLQLWQSNGTTTSRVKDINTGGNDAVASLTNVNGSLFFTANDGSTRIWKSDGTDAGTVAVSASYTGITPHNFTAVGNRLFFTAETTITVLLNTNPDDPTVFTPVTGTTGEELFVL